MTLRESCPVGKEPKSWCCWALQKVDSRRTIWQRWLLPRLFVCGGGISKVPHSSFSPQKGAHVPVTRDCARNRGTYEGHEAYPDPHLLLRSGGGVLRGGLHAFPAGSEKNAPKRTIFWTLYLCVEGGNSCCPSQSKSETHKLWTHCCRARQNHRPRRHAHTSFFPPTLAPSFPSGTMHISAVCLEPAASKATIHAVLSRSVFSSRSIHEQVDQQLGQRTASVQQRRQARPGDQQSFSLFKPVPRACLPACASCFDTAVQLFGEPQERGL